MSISHPIPPTPPHHHPDLRIIDLGRLSYAAAFDLQLMHHAEVLEAREAGVPEIGRLLLVEHDPPVITISRRPGARDNLRASESFLASRGITLAETDRGGDITYHGPGQLVIYPIIDLNLLKLGLHGYMRLLEEAVITCCAAFGLPCSREHGATGVWTDGPRASAPDQQPRKIAAMGVRVRRWVTMHGLALNISTNLTHFAHIIPCGLVGREVTSLERELGPKCPTMVEVKRVLSNELSAALRAERAKWPG